MQIFHLFCKKKPTFFLFFFYFTHPLLQNTHISLSILHIYSIKYSFFLLFFIIFFTSLSLTAYLSLIDQPPSPSNQPPQLHHHQPIQPNIINSPDHINPHTRNPIQPKRNPNTRNPIQPKRKPNQPHSTRNPLIKQPEIKESNQIGGEINDWWRWQSMVVVARDWFTVLIWWRKRKRVRDN